MADNFEGVVFLDAASKNTKKLVKLPDEDSFTSRLLNLKNRVDKGRKYRQILESGGHIGC
jgi:hypothetical protein